MNNFMYKFYLFVITGILISFIYGYIANIVKFVKLDFKTPVKAEVLRGVGIIIPVVGGIEGLIKIKD